MFIGIVLVLFALFFYLLLRGATQGRDRALEDQAQAEYMRTMARRKRRQEQQPPL